MEIIKRPESKGKSREYINKIKKMLGDQGHRNARFAKDWERYKTADVSIFHRVLPIQQKINNRINHDYVGVLVNTKVSHYLGNEISIAFDESNDDKANKLSRFRRYTAFDRVLTELGIQAAIFGYGVCLAYIDSRGKFDFMEIDPWLAYFSDDLCFRLISETDDEGNQYHVIEAFDEDKRYYYTLIGETVEPLKEYKGLKSDVCHLFDRVPLFKFKNNKEELSETYRVRHIINTVDKMVSDLASEIEQFRLAYIKFVGVVPTPEQIEQMLQTGAIAIPGDNPNLDVGFITKNIDIKGVLDAIDLEVKNIFKFAQTYDCHADREGYGQLTNLGIHFLMAPINGNCKKTIHYFKEALYQLFDFYSQTTDGNWLDPLEISFNFTLDTPRNILEETQIQQNLVGLVSDETRLSLATFVDDPTKELQRMEDEDKDKEPDAYEGLGDADDSDR